MHNDIKIAMIPEKEAQVDNKGLKSIQKMKSIFYIIMSLHTAL